MKTLFSLLLFIWSISAKLVAQEKERVTLRIEVSIVKYNQGNILLALYNTEGTYMKKPYRSSNISVKEKKAVIVYKNIEKGSYAFSLFHDINGNNKLDKNFFGIPKEPYRFSNNQKGRFGPPVFKDAVFKIVQNKTIKLTIN